MSLSGSELRALADHAGGQLRRAAPWCRLGPLSAITELNGRPAVGTPASPQPCHQLLHGVTLAPSPAGSQAAQPSSQHRLRTDSRHLSTFHSNIYKLGFRKDGVFWQNESVAKGKTSGKRLPAACKGRGGPVMALGGRPGVTGRLLPFQGSGLNRCVPMWKLSQGPLEMSARLLNLNCAWRENITTRDAR